jgi:phospholipase C
VVISPWIPRNVVDHRIHDHTTILATLENLFGMAPLTQRDAAANSLTELLTLAGPRSDAPADLPLPANSGVGGCPPFDFATGAVLEPAFLPPISCPLDSVNHGNIAGVLQAALRSDLQLSGDAARSKVLAQFSAIKTRADAMQYATLVRSKVRTARGA